jgi:altronate dehydratase small subunit
LGGFIVLNQKDNVAVAVENVKPDEPAELSTGRSLTALGDIPFAHKIAIVPIFRGDKVYKYGEAIGEATRDIKAGEHVHVHNIRSLRATK